jgi:NTP pyrophosphatase (non-canonical NTP hydrolase)
VNSEELQVQLTTNRKGKAHPDNSDYDWNFADTPIFETLAKEMHETSVEKGFWGEPVFMDKIAAKLALVHSEVTEILEALRKSQGAYKVTEEFADVFIRSLDVYEVLVEEGMAEGDLEGVIRAKMKANAERPPKHGHVWG